MGGRDRNGWRTLPQARLDQHGTEGNKEGMSFGRVMRTSYLPSVLRHDTREYFLPPVDADEAEANRMATMSDVR